MHDWVVSTKDDLEKFKMEFEDHFDLHYCLIYYVYTFFALMVDQRAKNMFLTYWGETGKWQPWFYDNDTSFGINNEGQLVFDYYHEDIDQLDDANVYNGQNSTLWVNFRQAFADEIKETYQDLRNNGFITYDKLENRFITQGSDKWSEAIYNEDGDFKYISMLRSDNDATNLPQVRGSGEEHFRYFIENRLNYCDSKWYASDYANDYISLRIYTPSTWSGIAPNPAITVTPFSNMYAGVRYKANGALYQERATHGVPVTFRPKGETFESENNESFNDTETAVYGAHQLSSIGDLAPLYCGSINVSNADKLIELKVGDATEGYSNANLRELSVGTNKLLKKIDVRNCPNFASVLALSNCPGIEEVYATGTAITGVEFPESGCLRVAHLPASIANLTIKHQLYIEDLTIAGYSNLKTLWIENCPTVDALDILSKATNADRVRLTDLDLKYDSAAEMLALATRSIGGIDENGVNIDKMWLDGKCHIKALTGSELATIVDAFPYLTITYEVLTSNLIFMSEDGSTELGRQLIQNGADGNYTGNIPTKDSTAQYHFTFAGWSLTPGGSVDADALKNVEANRYVYAAFSGDLRSYTVKFYNGSTLLQTVTVKYGTTATYTGDIPVNNSTGNPADFEFYGWKPEPTNIQGDTSCYAQFYDLREIKDDWATIAANVANGTATSKYSIGAFKTLNIGKKELPYEFNQGSAVVYDGEIHILGSVISEYRTSHYKWDGTEWVEVGVIPYEFYYGSAVVYNNEIHILGGSSSSSGRTKHYKWDGSNWTSVSTLPYVFEKGVAIVYDNEIHIMGSGNSSNYTSHYKWNGSAWSEVGKLPYSFYTASGFIYNNEIHVLGSYDSNYETAHYKYDGSSWTSVNTLPQKLSNGHALVIGADIYMIQWDEFYKYDGASWHACPDVPANVYDGRSVVLDDNIYVMGSSVSGNGRVFYSYAPETSTWSKVGITETIPMEIVAHNHDELASEYKWETVGELPHYFYRGACVNLNGEIHILGSGNANHNKKHYKYDGSNWTSVSTLPYGFYYSSAVVYNNEIHILGGNGVDTNHYKWNGAEWVSVSTLPYNFYRGIAVVFNNEIHIMGSADTSYRLTHYKWDGSTWTSVGAPPYGIQDTSAVVLNNEIHILGSYMSGSETAHYKYDGSTWTEVSTLPYNFYRGAAVVLNNEIHIVGSNDSTENGMKHYKWNGSTWIEDLQLPAQFYEGCAIVYDGKLTLVGNYANSAYRFFKQLVGPSWERQEDLPSGNIHFWNTGTFVINNVIYTMNYGYIYTYDGENITQITTTSMTVNGSMFVYNGEIYTVDDYNPPQCLYKLEGTELVKICEVPFKIHRTGIIEYNGRVHFIGGSYENSHQHYVWDGAEWTKMDNYPADPTNIVVYNNAIHTLGWTDHYKYSEIDGVSEIVKMDTLPFATSGDNRVFVHDNYIYALSGNDLYRYDGNGWTQLASVPSEYDTVHARFINFRGKIHVFGGSSGKRMHYILCNPRATLTFLAGNVLSEPRSMNNYQTNLNGWSAMQLRQYLNSDFLTTLPSELRTAISEVRKISDVGYIDGSTGSLTSSNDKIWILSADEIGETSDTYNIVYGQGDVYPCFSDVASRMFSTTSGQQGSYWLRTSNYANVMCFYNQDGSANSLNSKVITDEYYILIGFCI